MPQLDSPPAFAIDIRSQTLIALRDVPAYHARTTRSRRRVHHSATYRWAQVGVLGVLLPTVRIGGQRYTSEEAFAWWVDATTRRDQGRADVVQPAVSPRDDDEALLREAGIA